MPKPRVTCLTLKKEIYELLKAKAKAAHMGINEFLERILLGQSHRRPKTFIYQ